MKIPYSEGSVFLVPLRNDGYARGVIARTGDDGKILLGYFFGPRLGAKSAATFTDLSPAKAILRIRFGDLGLINGDWSIMGNLPNWNRSEWPMPQFVRRDPLLKRAWLVQYSDDDPNRIDAEHRTDYDSMLAPDSVAGYGAVEIKLTKLLG